MIQLERVHYRYPDAPRPALAWVDLQIGDGDLFVLAGASGSGKSTLLRSINGLVPHFHGGNFSGSVIVDGTSTLDVQPRQLAEQVGFVGQDPEDQAVAGIVEDDIAFTLENLGFSQTLMRKRVEEVLDALGIADLRHRDLDTLSGGERQRAALAAALVAAPSHLILDEPTSQLDPHSADEVIASLLKLCDELGVTVVVAEQRLERILGYAGRMGVMIDGSLEEGDPRDLLERHDFGPPIAKLGRLLGWQPIPLTLREARGHLRDTEFAPASEQPATGQVHEASGEIVVSMRRARVALGARAVVRDLSMDVREGEVVFLMGRNGSGKTTVLRTLAGLVRPERGSVDRRGTAGFVPQDPKKILFRKTVRQEIEATLEGRGLSSSYEHVLRNAELFRVDRLLERYPLDLSGGEKTRVAIAAACAGNPGLLLLDEPTRGMDEETRHFLIELLASWSRQRKAVVVATHDVELAAVSASRVLLIAEGELIADGPPQEVLAGSLTFSTQLNRVFRRQDVLTVDDATRAVLGA